MRKRRKSEKKNDADDKEGGEARKRHIAACFVLAFARARAREAPARLRASVTRSLVRWSVLLAHSAMTAFASSLLCQTAGPGLCNVDVALPPYGDLLADAGGPSPLASRGEGRAPCAAPGGCPVD